MWLSHIGVHIKIFVPLLRGALSGCVKGRKYINVFVLPTVSIYIIESARPGKLQRPDPHFWIGLFSCPLNFKIAWRVLRYTAGTMTEIQERKDDALSFLMSPDRYAVMKHSSPYHYDYGTNETLAFFGTEHSTNPEHEQYNALGQKIKDHAPDVICVEGVQALNGPAGIERMIASMSRDTAIRRGGEPIFAIREALEAKTPWLCPEPEDSDLYNFLVSEYYSREEVLAWSVLNLLPQYQDREEAMNFAGYIAPFIAQFKEAVGWTSVSYDLKDIESVIQKMIGRSLPLMNIERAHELVDPIPWLHRWEEQCMSNDMARAALRYRDETIVSHIAGELAEGKRVLVVYGAGHAVMQEPVWRYLLS